MGGPTSQPKAMSEKYDYVFKFIIIGDTGTGKSCLLHQFVEGKCGWKAGEGPGRRGDR